MIKLASVLLDLPYELYQTMKFYSIETTGEVLAYLGSLKCKNETKWAIEGSQKVIILMILISRTTETTNETKNGQISEYANSYNLIPLDFIPLFITT